MQGGSLSQVRFDSLLSFWRAQSRVGPSPGDAQDRFMHVDRPEVAGGFSGVWRELPLLSLLVVTQLVDGAPQTRAPYACLIDELLHRLQVAHDGVS